MEGVFCRGSSFTGGCCVSKLYSKTSWVDQVVTSKAKAWPVIFRVVITWTWESFNWWRTEFCFCTKHDSDQLASILYPSSFFPNILYYLHQHKCHHFWYCLTREENMGVSFFFFQTSVSLCMLSKFNKVKLKFALVLDQIIS